MRRQHYDERRAISTDGRPIPPSSGNHGRNDFAGSCGLVLIKRDYMMWHDPGRRCMRGGTRARARRENDEVDVHCRITPEDIHHTLMANNDVECMLPQVEGYSRNRKLDELWCGRGHSWNAGADHKLTTGCQSGCLKHSSAEEQLEMDASKSQDLQRRETVDIGTRADQIVHSHGDDVREQRSEPESGHSVESDIDDTKRRIGEIQE